MNKIFEFGQKVDTLDYMVINERDARASAGIMFLIGIISLFAVFLTHSLFLAEWFSITFIVEFLVRVLINPRYAPYMILGRLIVSNQTPDWVEAAPKKFAWIIGLILGLIMAYFIVFDIMTPARILTCVVCLILLYMESVFGICLGCLMYHKFNKKLENCPGGVCETDNKLKIPRSNIIVLFVFVLLFAVGYKLLDDIKYSDDITSITTKTKKQKNKKTDKDCEIPQYAIDMGHEKLWLKHNGCDNK
ncbi:MAG: DUF4395 domain-containing protein [Epsilonproteobacteria bacterium]|nr:MAG: DUF4395 domain-containing protein [Campylobacterota bacterium]